LTAELWIRHDAEEFACSGADDVFDQGAEPESGADWHGALGDDRVVVMEIAGDRYRHASNGRRVCFAVGAWWRADTDEHDVRRVHCLAEVIGEAQRPVGQSTGKEDIESRLVERRATGAQFDQFRWV
jgi:hypothetical protein